MWRRLESLGLRGAAGTSHCAAVPALTQKPMKRYENVANGF